MGSSGGRRWGEGSREWLRGGDGKTPGTVSGERLLVGLLGTHGVCRDMCKVSCPYVN